MVTHAASLAAHSHPSSRKRTRVRDFMSRAAWLLQWVFVLLLAFDQIGSPLHKHHHDSGIDGTGIAAQPIDTSPTHISDPSYRNSPHFSHPTTAVQFNACPSVPIADDDLAAAWFCLLDALLALSPEVTETGPPPAATWIVRPPSLHAALPPDGRAPPPRTI